MKLAWRALLDRDRLDADMEEEMRYHVELETEELINGGLTRAEARRQAAIAFGGIVQQRERSIETSRFAWLIHLRRDTRIALRSLRRHPTYTVTATLALALAIAVNTSMFSILDAMINPNAGVTDPEHIYQLRYFGDPKEKVDFREATDAVEAAGAQFSRVTQFSGQGVVFERGPRLEEGALNVVRPNFFSFLGAHAIAGRLDPAPDAASIARSVVISDRLAASMYARGEAIVGSQIVINREPRTVIGVVARYAGLYGLDFNAWTFESGSKRLGGALFIRLNDGVTKEQAEARLQVLAAQRAQAAGVPARDSRFSLQPVLRQFHADRFHFALMGAGIAILLVACTNLANLQLARGLGRSSELAVRASLGATQRQNVTQLVVESGVLAAVALVISLAFAMVANSLVRATVPPKIETYVVEPQASWRMIAFASVAAVVCVITVGLLPALRVAKVDLNAFLKSRAGTGAHKANRRVYGMLVIVQIAFTLPLVCAAVLTLRAAQRASSMDYLIHEVFGYDPRPLITIPLGVRIDTAGPTPITDLSASFINRARGVAGVTNAAIMRHRSTEAITVDGPDGGFRVIPTPQWSYGAVSPAYLRTMGYPMLEGSDFSEGTNAEPGIIIDRETANYLWPGKPAVGRLMKFGGERSSEPFLRVQGVVGDYATPEVHDRLRQMRQSRIGAVYRVLALGETEPKPRYPVAILMMTVRTTADVQHVAVELRRALNEGTVMPPRPSVQLDYLGIRQQRVVTRFIAGLFTTFGLLALGLSALGVYAIVAQSVADRKREVAVRASLGATPRQIVYALLREGNVLVLAGVAIGLFMAKQTIVWLGVFLGETDITNAPLFAAICIALFAILVAAAMIPAVLATRMNPMDVLRAE